MTRALWLIRHAKSDWHQGLPDHDRPLNARGRRDGPMMAAWLATQENRPGWIWVSSAVRARETAAFVAQGCKLAEDSPVVEPSLYHASPQAALEVLQVTPPDATAVAVVFHNPGITSLVNLLAGEHVLDNLPTFGVARFAVSGSWVDLSAASCRLLALDSPKALKRASE